MDRKSVNEKVKMARVASRLTINPGPKIKFSKKPFNNENSNTVDTTGTMWGLKSEK